jgi:4-amino-4-deoxy-L-arabinose transferase-like glycosyltransferase
LSSLSIETAPGDSAAASDPAAASPAVTTNQARGRDLLIAAVVTVAALVPFLNKPFHIDDPLFLWTAQRVRVKPTDFYGFQVNWYGFEQQMFEVTKNPPGVSFYLAATSLILGLGELGVHLALLVPAVGLVIGTYLVAERYTKRPLFAALATVATPAWLVSATTAMCDISMLCLWMWAVYYWLQALDTGRFGQFLAAGMLIAAAALTKYFAITLVPLLALIALRRRRYPYECTLALLLPIIALVLFDVYTTMKYDQGLVRDVLPYSGAIQQAYDIDRLTQLLLGISFLGGSTVTFVLFLPRMGNWRGGLCAVGATTLLAAVCIRDGEFIGLPVNTEHGREWGVLFHTLLFLLVAVQAAGLVGLEVWNRRDEATLLLVPWIVGTWIFAAFLNWTVNVRTLLPLVPALAILLARCMDRAAVARPAVSRAGWLRGGKLFDAVAMAVALGVSLAVAWGDYQFAVAQRALTEQARQLFAGVEGQKYYQGHWGFQYYLEQMRELRAMPLKVSSEFVFSSDRMVAPGNNTNIYFWPPDLVSEGEQRFVPVNSWVITNAELLGAGFYYGRVGRPFPFRVVPAPDEYIRSFNFKASFQLKH